MDPKHKLSLNFGTPTNGWLPTQFIYDNFKLAIEISDVPINPMVQLCNALIQISKGIKQADIVFWHMEPFCYYLQLAINEKEYSLTILESVDFKSSRKVAIVITGDFEGVILPLYRGLKSFWSHSFKSPHWEEIPDQRIKELSALIKNIKLI